MMIALDQARRIDQIRPANRVENVGHGHARDRQARGVRRDLKLGDAPTLHHHRRHTVETIEPRFDVVGRDFPQDDPAEPYRT